MRESPATAAFRSPSLSPFFTLSTEITEQFRRERPDDRTRAPCEISPHNSRVKGGVEIDTREARCPSSRLYIALNDSRFPCLSHFRVSSSTPTSIPYMYTSTSRYVSRYTQSRIARERFSLGASTTRKRERVSLVNEKLVDKAIFFLIF